jgi:hypothetical protein
MKLRLLPPHASSKQGSCKKLQYQQHDEACSNLCFHSSENKSNIKLRKITSRSARFLPKLQNLVQSWPSLCFSVSLPHNIWHLLRVPIRNNCGALYYFSCRPIGLSVLVAVNSPVAIAPISSTASHTCLYIIGQLISKCLYVIRRCSQIFKSNMASFTSHVKYLQEKSKKNYTNS